MSSGFTWRDEIAGGSTDALVRQLDDMLAGQDALFHWTDVPYAASNFSGTGAMVWTVTSGDVGTFAYARLGRLLWISVVLLKTSVSGTPDVVLQVRLPLGLTATKTMYTVCTVLDGGVFKTGQMRVQNGSPFLAVFLQDASTAWTATTNGTYIFGQIMCEAA